MALILTDKQKEYIRNANSRWNIKVGAVRSGKSYVDVAYVILSRILDCRHKSGLNVILGVSRDSIERNVLEPMREIYGDRLVGYINGRNIAKIAGEDVYCLGAEKVSQVAKIQGTSIKYCYGDEIAKWNQDVFRMLQSRLDKRWSKFDGACNPESPTHWLKKFLDTDGLDAYIQKYVIFDNTFLPQSYVDNLCKEYSGTIYYKRYILGEWALAEGLIYQRYSDAICDNIPTLAADDYCLSIDYGTQNAFAALLWKKINGVWYAYDEYYYSGRDSGTQKTDEEYANDIDAFVSDIPLKNGQKLRTIIDPSAASFIALLKKRGGYKVQKADNDVSDGIRETAMAMADGAIKLSKNLKNLIRELEGYVWDEKSNDDKPIKINDHACDALRYFVKTMHIVRKFSRSEMS